MLSVWYKNIGRSLLPLTVLLLVGACSDTVSEDMLRRSRDTAMV